MHATSRFAFFAAGAAAGAAAAAAAACSVEFEFDSFLCFSVSSFRPRRKRAFSVPSSPSCTRWSQAARQATFLDKENPTETCFKVPPVFNFEFHPFSTFEFHPFSTLTPTRFQL